MAHANHGACEAILEEAKKHIKFLSKTSETNSRTLFLVDSLLLTSSEHPTREMLDDFQLKMFTLCTDTKLNDPIQAAPNNWFHTINQVKEKVSVTFEEFANQHKIASLLRIWVLHYVKKFSVLMYKWSEFVIQ